jgi:phosphoribosylformylglycinamidine (FGAM) synthase-like enzyme
MTDTTAILDHLTAEQDEAAGLEHGIKADEWERLVTRLNRKPNLVELGIYSVMWSEHCSYKSSRRHLSKFPTKNDHVIQGPGENAGVVDIGDGQASSSRWKATTTPLTSSPTRARPPASAASCAMSSPWARARSRHERAALRRAGSSQDPHLVSGVVAGIGGYGNSFGVPTVAASRVRSALQRQHCLVNAMAVGLADGQDFLLRSQGRRPAGGLSRRQDRPRRHPRRDHGVGRVRRLDEEKRPTVQVGDPFTEKCLLEACLELMATGAVIAIQDMGAAGLTCSAVEMGAKGDLGIELDLDTCRCAKTA